MFFVSSIFFFFFFFAHGFNMTREFRREVKFSLKSLIETLTVQINVSVADLGEGPGGPGGPGPPLIFGQKRRND